MHSDHQETMQDTMFEEATAFPDEYLEASPYEAQEEIPEALDEELPAPAETADRAEVMRASESEQPTWRPDPESAAPQSPVLIEEAEPLTVLTVDDFAALEERIVRAVSLVRRERDARVAAEERLLLLESQVLAHAPQLEQLQQEVASLRTEREQVRQRVERLLGQLDALEL